MDASTFPSKPLSVLISHMLIRIAPSAMYFVGLYKLVLPVPRAGRDARVRRGMKKASLELTLALPLEGLCGRQSADRPADPQTLRGPTETRMMRGVLGGVRLDAVFEQALYAAERGGGGEICGKVRDPGGVDGGAFGDYVVGVRTGLERRVVGARDELGACKRLVLGRYLGRGGERVEPRSEFGAVCDCFCTRTVSVRSERSKRYASMLPRFAPK
ncbi:hypothetical protein L1887_55958 [Cichorium endivia]|nr:hypothetical protein L1887_55958 [Cichorium endivia]